MQPQDQFASALAAMVARLTPQVESLRDVADVDLEAAPTYWRLALVPHTSGACPLELVVDPAAQVFDLQVGPDVHERVAIDRIGDLADIVVSVIEGRASRRTGASAAGGATL